MSIEEDFRRKFGFGLERPFNDYSYDRAQDGGLSYSLNLMRETNPKKFKRIREFASKHRNLDNEHLMLLNAHLLYMDKKYDRALKLFLAIASKNPLDINRWIDLAFGLLHAKKYYALGLDLLFNLYGYIHYCLKLNLQTINIPNLLLIQRAMKSSKDYNNKYLFPIKFEEEFLILSRECNNNCITCPNETRDRLALDCSIREYIERKIGKPYIKKLVFTGGEPTILPDFFCILQEIFSVRPDIKLVIQTNGRAFFDPGFIHHLGEFRNKDLVFEVSLFSHKPAVHDRIARCRGSFVQTIKGIENLLGAGCMIVVNLGLSELNKTNFQQTLDCLHRSYPALSKINIVPLLPSGNCLTFPCRRICHK